MLVGIIVFMNTSYFLPLHSSVETCWPSQCHQQNTHTYILVKQQHPTHPRLHLEKSTARFHTDPLRRWTHIPGPEDKKNATLTDSPSIRIQAKRKNTYSILLHAAKVYLYKEKESAQIFRVKEWKCESLGPVQLCDPVDHSPPRASLHGILQARILEWVVIPFFKGSSWPREQTQVSCTAGR